MFAIVVSKKDLAGMNIKQCLLKQFDFKPTGSRFEGSPIYSYKGITLYTTSEESINCEHIDKKLNAKLIVFATKHRSEAGRASLSVHAPGNWGKAELGGMPQKLCIAPALYMKAAFINLAENASHLSYEITLEVTHHGPYLTNTPCFFIEIGSSEKQWQDAEAGMVIARTIISTLLNKPQEAIPCIGFGGGHYAPYFNKIMLGSGYALGHICPKYGLEGLNAEMVSQAIERTVPKPNLALLDWKGLGPRKQELLEILKGLGIEHLRCRKVLKTNI
ncbi:D-tyrosyl-tRNA(Tyr) deacylase [Candidatus Woesearchaeota archaeon]|nr:MAG: D-tyrosyl-tRNA(Tyr) deacylase [Candidatus Woesearchaeota archaeon]